MGKNVVAAAQSTKAEDILGKLRECLGEKVLRALRDRKAQLHIWRRSSPHNWYVLRTGKRYEQLWHSETRSGYPRQLPDLGAFELVEHSANRIQTAVPMAENGRPEGSVYRLKSEFCNQKHRR